MASAFILPQVLPAMKIGWLNDWLSDLMWIKQKDIVLLVYDYDLDRKSTRLNSSH